MNNIYEINGTHLQQVINTPYWALENLFGKPKLLLKAEGDGKIQAQWEVITPYGVGTIYDWKEYEKPYEEVREWHIGGHNGATAEWIANKIIFADIARGEV